MNHLHERQAFLDAIRADFDSDAPRLIYADWLDEHGESERAALIRFQCAEIADDPVEVTAVGDREGRVRGPRPRCDVAALSRRLGLELGPLGADELLGFRRGFLAGFRYPYNPKLSALRTLLADEVFEECHVAVTGPTLASSAAGLGRDLIAAARSVAVAPRPGTELVLGELPACRQFRASGRGRVEVWLPAAERLEASGVTASGLGRLLRACGRPPAGFDVKLGPVLAADELPESDGLTALGLRNVPLGAVPAALGRFAACRLDEFALRVADPAFGDDTGDPGPAERAAERWPPASGLRQLAVEGLWPLPGLARSPHLEALGGGAWRLGAWPPGLTALEVPGSFSLRRDSMATLVRDLPPLLTRLRVRAATTPDVHSLAASESLAGLEALRLDGPYGEPPVGLGPGEIEALAGSAFGPNLRALTLGRVHDRAARRAALERFGPRCDAYWQTGAER